MVMLLGEKFKRVYSTLVLFIYLFILKKFNSPALMNKFFEDGIWTMGTVQSN